MQNYIVLLQVSRYASLVWKQTLLGLLLVMSLMVSGCASNSPKVAPAEQTYRVDAALMVEPTLTEETLSVFSQ